MVSWPSEFNGKPDTPFHWQAQESIRFNLAAKLVCLEGGRHKLGLSEHTQVTARWMVSELRGHPQYLVVSGDLEAVGKRSGLSWDLSSRNSVLNRQAVEFFIVMTWALEIEVLKSGTRCNHRL